MSIGTGKFDVARNLRRAALGYVIAGRLLYVPSIVLYIASERREWLVVPPRPGSWRWVDGAAPRTACRARSAPWRRLSAFVAAVSDTTRRPGVRSHLVAIAVVVVVFFRYHSPPACPLPTCKVRNAFPWRKGGIGQIWWSVLRCIKGLQLSILSLYLPWIVIIKAHVVTWPN